MECIWSMTSAFLGLVVTSHIHYEDSINMKPHLRSILILLQGTEKSPPAVLYKEIKEADI
ncbi:hypothetical protein OnM2_083008 [Erysiphe neolycopersici]|uniref:Uncharacterized protein n=1 Tax=Erysiphe neolycopersici TaxID=212602 RepID=A0A420HFM8_9PEZI|nr:hypothetical protein OnM2_083008 [Erysiphe neolycopersici]